MPLERDRKSQVNNEDMYLQLCDYESHFMKNYHVLTLIMVMYEKLTLDLSVKPNANRSLVHVLLQRTRFYQIYFIS